jgi:protein involved in polysaccharide export with SLBB domain
MRKLFAFFPILLLLTGCARWRTQTVLPDQLAADMQATAPTKLRPLQLASLGGPIQSEFHIHPGDMLDVTVSDLIGENAYYPVPTRVMEDGTVRLPLVGGVTLAGLSIPGAEQAIFAAYSSQGMLKKPQVTVALRETRKVRVYVLGAVNKPGLVELNATEADLLSALVNSGGLNQEAGTVVEVRRRLTSNSTPVPIRKDRNVVQSSYGQMAEPLPIRKDRNLVQSSSGQLADPLPSPWVYSAGAWRPDYNKVVRAGYSDSPYHAVGPSSEGVGIRAGVSVQSPYRTVGNNGPTPAPVRQLHPSILRADATISASPAPPAPADNQVIRLDLTSEQDKQRLTQGFRLENGDTISIDDRKTKPIYVIGMVNKPGEFPLPIDRDLRVLEAIGLAGGVDRGSLPDKALVIRQRPDGSGVVAIRIDLNNAKKDNSQNIRLMAGDTLSVEETVMSYTRGLLRGALRFGVGASWVPTVSGF